MARSHGDQESRPGFTTIRRHSQGSPPVWQTLEASRKVRDSQESRTDGLKGKEWEGEKEVDRQIDGMRDIRERSRGG